MATQKHRVSMTVETFGVVDALYHPGGVVTRELARHLGIDPEAGWRSSDVEILTGVFGPGLVTVKLYRDVPFDVTQQER